jgi:hypothetical protein
MAGVAFLHLGSVRIAMTRKQNVRMLLFWIAVVVAALVVYLYAQAQIEAS